MTENIRVPADFVSMGTIKAYTIGRIDASDASAFRLVLSEAQHDYVTRVSGEDFSFLASSLRDRGVIEIVIRISDGPAQSGESEGA